MSQLARILVNTLGSSARLVVSLLVWIILTPVMLRVLGVDDFGLWQLIGSTVGLFQLLDVGFGVGVVSAVGQATGNGDLEGRNRTLSTYLAAYLALAVIAAVGLGLFGLWFPQLFSLSPASAGKARVVLWLMGLRLVVFALPFSLYRGVLVGEQRIGQANLVQGLSLVVYGAAALLAMGYGAGLMTLAMLSLAAMLLEHAAYVALAFRWTPQLHVSVSLVDLRPAMGLSVAQMLIALSGLIRLRTDPVIVQLFIGLPAVAAYTIALRVAEQGFLAIKQFIYTLSPVVARLHGQKNEGMLRVVLLTGTKIGMVPAALLVGVTVPLGQPALAFWVGPELAIVAPTMTVLVVAMALAVPREVVFNLFVYTGRHRLPGLAAIVGAGLNLVATLLLVRPFGLLGVAMGTLISTLVVDVGWVSVFACRLYQVRYRDYRRAALLPALLPAVPQIAITLLLVRGYPPSSLFAVLLYTLPGVAAYLGAFWMAGLSADERREARSLLIPARVWESVQQAVRSTARVG